MKNKFLDTNVAVIDLRDGKRWTSATCPGGIDNTPGIVRVLFFCDNCCCATKSLNSMKLKKQAAKSARCAEEL